MISKTIRTIILLAAIAGLVAIVFVVKLQGQKQITSDGVPPNPPPPKSYPHSVSGSGIIEAFGENTAIGVPRAGLVEKLNVEVNQHVEKDDVLFVLDATDLKAQLTTAKARIGTAEAAIAVASAQLARSRAQLERIEGILDSRAVSREDRQNRRDDLAIAEAQLSSATAERAAAEAETTSVESLISQLTVTAPKAGTILQVNIREGEFAATSPKDPAILMGETKKLQVRVDIDEQSASRIRPGQAAQATLKGDSSVSFPLRFLRIEPYVIPKVSLTGASTERVDTRVLQVIFTLDPSSDLPLYVGQQVDIAIEAPEQ